MNRDRLIFSTLSILLILGSQAVAQQSRPSPTPDTDDVVRISTNLVQLDVSITDSKGNPITDIRPEEVEIFENGKKQTITNFSFISSQRPSAKQATATKIEDGIAVPAPPAELRPEQVRRTFVIVIDDLSLSFESAYHTRRAVRKFVTEQMEDGDLVSIVRVGGSTGAIQQFTNDKRILLAAANAIKWNPRSGRISAFVNISPGPLESLRTAGETTITEAQVAAERQAQMAEGRPGVEAVVLVESLHYVVEGLSEMPGRKSVILFSDGFPLIDEDPSGFINPSDVGFHLSRLIESANRASVVFYTLDPQGLVYTGPTAADKMNASTNPQQFTQILSTRSTQLFDSQNGPTQLAKKTGGLSFVNQNDLSRGIEKAMIDQSYYLVGYEPDSESFDPAKIRFNKFEIRVSRPGANVRHRNGFLGVAEKNISNNTVTPRLTVNEQLNAALRSPFAKNEITLNLNPLFGHHPRTGNYVKSLLHVNVNDLKFTDLPDGMKQAEIGVLAGSFGMDGNVVDQIGKGFTIALPAEVYERLKATGFVYEFTFPVKKPGSYQFRVVLRDQGTGNIGSASQFIEIPNFKKESPFISGAVLQSYTADEWLRMSATNTLTSRLESDVKTDTSRRRFNLGSVVQYGFEIYNAQLGPGKKPDVTTRIRVFRDGELLMAGEPVPLDVSSAANFAVLNAGGAIRLNEKMLPGEYVLQFIVIDNNAKPKNRIGTQFVMFDVVD